MEFGKSLSSNRGNIAIWAAIILTFTLPCTCKTSFAQEQDDEIQKRLERVLQALPKVIPNEMSKEKIPGCAIAIVHRGKIKMLQGYGFANVDSKQKVDPKNSVFRIGSISKAVTFLALAKLCTERGIALDKNVFEIADNLPKTASRHGPVSIEHLFQHTGGFDQIGTNRVFKSPDSRPRLGPFLQRELRTIRPAGQLPCYDTYGPTLAGYLIEKLSGTDYSSYMQKRFFASCGMEHSYVEVPKKNRNQLVTGYGVTNDKLVPQAYEYYATTPASSIDSTAHDMAQLLKAILTSHSEGESKVFPTSLIKAIHEPSKHGNSEMPSFKYGFWEMFRRGNTSHPILYHGGQVDGYSAGLYMVPSKKFGVFIAVNRNSETGPRVRMTDDIPLGIIDRIFGFKPARIVGEIEPFATDSKQVAGIYLSNLYCHTKFEGDGWPDRGRPIKVESAGSGKIKIMGEIFIAVDPLTYRNPKSQEVVLFHQRPDKTICGKSYNFHAPGTTYEKIDMRLVKEVFGDQPSEPNPLRAIVLRLTGHWKEAAEIYQKHAVSVAGDRLSGPWAYYRAGTCLIEASAFRTAEKMLLAARQQFQQFESGRSKFTTATFASIARNMRNRTNESLVIALVAQKKFAEAEKVVVNASTEFGSEAKRWIKSFSKDKRMKRLFEMPSVKKIIE